MRKLFILGLDSAPPKILYEDSSIELGGLREVIEDSARFILRSCHPPITIPAWISMFTGKTPGELGIYGFRHRKPGDVRESYIVNSTFIKVPTIWDVLGKHGYRVGVIGVPPTYPPKPVHGFMISDFTTPGPHKPYTFPPWIRKEIEMRFGPYIFDVVYRSHEKDKVREELFRMTKQHLDIVKYLLAAKEWDIFIHVEIGVDRVQHAFWKYFDTNHPRHIEHPVYSYTIREYYELIGKEFREIKKHLSKDTIIIIVSDHGAKAMKGAFVINQWLEKEGYLKLKEKPKRSGQDINSEIINWEHTIAWGWGGYYSRIFINL
ncbi:MAG: nucleotide pyrophosphatase, partial [Thermoprotei archaeon]